MHLRFMVKSTPMPPDLWIAKRQSVKTGSRVSPTTYKGKRSGSQGPPPLPKDSPPLFLVIHYKTLYDVLDKICRVPERPFDAPM